jgi:hypothetical protein
LTNPTAGTFCSRNAAINFDVISVIVAADIPPALPAGKSSIVIATDRFGCAAVCAAALDIKTTMHATPHHVQITHRTVLGNFMEPDLPTEAGIKP